MFDLPKYGDGVCLARLAELLDVLRVDRAWLQNRSVVVTGSNGKGSTAAMCAAIGRAHGLRTGLFTSPHLLRFNERIRIDGGEIGDEAFARLKQEIEPAISAISATPTRAHGRMLRLRAGRCRSIRRRCRREIRLPRPKPIWERLFSGMSKCRRP